MNSPLGMIVTFYSWKGGVGRTMALANVAIQLARKGHSVLAVDWDLEAPGLDRYFLGKEAREKGNVGSRQPADRSGLIGFLDEAFHQKSAGLDVSMWRRRLISLSIPKSEASSSEPSPPTPNRLDFLPSGYGFDGYADKLARFSWFEFFARARGGEWLEALRDQWASAYEFVLIDSRTGLTDGGGVCTIQMPQILVLVFSANDQSVEGGLEIVAAAQQGRIEFDYDRPPLSVIPLLSRWEGENEVDIAEEWMRRLDIDLQSLTASWLPKDFSTRQFLEKTRVPHVPRFSFGEPLPVLTHSLTDPGLPGIYFDNIAKLLRMKLVDAGTIVDPLYSAPTLIQSDAEILELVLNQPKLHREIGRLSNSYGLNAPQLSAFLVRSAAALERLGRFNEAEPLMRRALAIDESLLGPDHPDTGERLNELAMLLRSTGRIAEAEPLVRRALAIHEKAFGPDHPDVTASLSNLALLLTSMGQFYEAEPLLRRALAIDEKNFGPTSYEITADLSNLAQLLQDTGRLDEAEQLMRRALAIDEKELGSDDPELATDLNNLAQILDDTDRLDEAESLMRRALAIDEKSLGLEHPELTADLSNLAMLLKKTGRLDESESLLWRVVLINEKSFGPDHPNVAVFLAGLGQLLIEAQRYAEAELLLRRALSIREKSFGTEHHDVAVALSSLAVLLDLTERNSEAQQMLRRALAIEEKNFGPDHPAVMNILNILALSLQLAGKSDEAEKLKRRARDIEQKNFNG